MSAEHGCTANKPSHTRDMRRKKCIFCNNVYRMHSTCISHFRMICMYMYDLFVVYMLDLYVLYMLDVHIVYMLDLYIVYMLDLYALYLLDLYICIYVYMYTDITYLCCKESSPDGCVPPHSTL